MSYAATNSISAQNILGQANAAMGLVAPKEPSLIEFAIRTNRCIAEELSTLLGRIEGIGIRTFGARPEEGQSSSAPPQPIGSEYELRSSAEHIENLISRLRRAVSEVERIA